MYNIIIIIACWIEIIELYLPWLLIFFKVVYLMRHTFVFFHFWCFYQLLRHLARAVVSICLLSFPLSFIRFFPFLVSVFQLNFIFCESNQHQIKAELPSRWHWDGLMESHICMYMCMYVRVHMCRQSDRQTDTDIDRATCVCVLGLSNFLTNLIEFA